MCHEFNDRIETIKPEIGDHFPSAKQRINHDNPSGPVAIDFIDDASERHVPENEKTLLPGCDDFGVDGTDRAETG